MASKRYNEKKQRQLEQAIDRELESGYGNVDAELNMAMDIRDAAMGKGEEELFEKKLTKEEKKAKAKAAREAKRKAKGGGKRVGGNKSGSDDGNDDDDDSEGNTEPTSVKSELDLQALDDELNNVVADANEDALEKLSRDNIVVTYESKKNKLHANTRDINVSGVTVSFHGKPLVEETQLVINYGNRYGFIGTFSNMQKQSHHLDRVVWPLALLPVI